MLLTIVINLSDSLFISVFKKIFIYLSVPGFCCSMQAL